MITIARPKKCRRVSFIPSNRHFVPFGKNKCEYDEIVLKIEEVEAIRLKDGEKLSQEECAEKMQVSRQTFQNVIGSAREKIAKALVGGSAISIHGGNYELSLKHKRCMKCKRQFGDYEEKENFCLHKCQNKKVNGGNNNE